MEGTTMSDMRRMMMMFPKPDGSTPAVTVDGYVAFLSDFDDTRTANTYINVSGAEAGYNGWDISGWIEIPDDAHYVYYDTLFTHTYTGVYNSSKTYMQHIYSGNILPDGAKYLRFSSSAANVSNGIAILLKEQRT